MIDFTRNINRRDFLKISAIAAGAPALLSGCVSPEIRKLEKSNPGVTPAQINLVEFFSKPLYFHPPATRELLELVVHLYTPEEAEVAQYLSLMFGQTALEISSRTGLPEEEVSAVLSRLADEKHAVLARGKDVKSRKYSLMPLVPGTFEMVMMEGRDDLWHRKFGRLFEAVYNTGYIKDILKKPMYGARYLPIEETVSNSPVVLSSDRLSEMINANKSFALGVCQCRQSRAYAGGDCGLPRDTCLATGKLADFLVERKIMRRIGPAEALDAKQRAVKAGLVTMSVNIQFDQPNISCSCCGDCCGILRTITQFNAPGFIAPPHYRPERDEGECTHCGLCVTKCPMGANVLSEGKWTYRRERCIGCGICSYNCPEKALAMQPVKNYSPPPASYLGLGLRNFPAYIRNLR